jgi:serine protease Do
MKPLVWGFAPLLLLTFAWFARGFAAEDLAMREEHAMQAAVARVANSVVRIETVGGLEQLGKLQLGEGPTTGLAVSSEGHIVSSAFNFIQKPSSILVTLPGGKRAPAKLVATDHNRMLVLLKVETDEPLVVPEAVPEEEIRVGQWAIAVGRAFDADRPNVSVGIVSAKNRIWGKAVQTDAKISPSNYGGPLVDIQGRVLGVLVPMSPSASQVVAGVEWYDSGIGFAVPLEHILAVLPRMEKGTDLHPGLMGVAFRAGNQYSEPAVIATSRPNSPAYEAGLKEGDEIVEIDGQPIIRQSQVKERVAPHYAGDTIKVVVVRGQERLERELTLVQTVEPYERPFLGLLPRRDADAGKGAVVVRYVYPESPAAKAGIEAGDRIDKLNGQAVAGRDELAASIAALEIKQPLTLSVKHGEESRELELTPAALPESVPTELPPAHDAPAAAAKPQVAVGRMNLHLAEFQNQCVAYVPEAYDAATPHGLLIWLSADGTYDADALVARFKPWCDRYEVILIAPQTVEPQAAAQRRRWNASADSEYIGKLVEQVTGTYHVDPSRIVAQGYQGGAAMAYVLAFSQRKLVRGAVAVDAPLAVKPLDHEPAYPMAFYLAKSSEPRSSALVDAAAKSLKQLKYPVTLRALDGATHDLTDEEQAEVMRWMDTLDRL